MWMRRCYTYYVAIYLWVSSQSWYCPWVQSISNLMLVVLLKLRLGCRKVVKWSLSLPKTSLGGVVYTSSTHAWVGLSGILAWAFEEWSQGRIWSDLIICDNSLFSWSNLIICNNSLFSWSNLKTKWERRSLASFLVQWRYKCWRQTNDAMNVREVYLLHT